MQMNIFHLYLQFDLHHLIKLRANFAAKFIKIGLKWHDKKIQVRLIFSIFPQQHYHLIIITIFQINIILLISIDHFVIA